MSPEISIVVPVFNEAGNLAILCDEIAAVLAGSSYELIVVDDGSTDGSTEGMLDDDVLRVVRFKRNYGQSPAMLAGLRAARAPVVVLMDGDRQNNPADIPRLMAALDEGADLVCGYRARRRDPWSKRVASRVANAIRRSLIGDGVRDAGCSLKAMRRECVEAIVPFRGCHRFIPALVKNAGFAVVEIAVDHRPRVAGQSKYGIGGRAVQGAADLLGVWWLNSRRLNYAVENRDGVLSQK
jgi:dolichol-phosphate mannosyltransferase